MMGDSVVGIPEPIIPTPNKQKRIRPKPKRKPKPEKLKTPPGDGFPQGNRLSIAEFVQGMNSTGDVIDALIASTEPSNLSGPKPKGTNVYWPDPGKKVVQKKNKTAKPTGFAVFAAELAVADLPTQKKPPPFRGV